MKIGWRGTFLIALAMILAMCSTAAPLFAQATTGAVAQISGTVSDPSGAVVPEAQVKATQTSTGFTRTAVTGSEGFYVLPALPIGPYELLITCTGFNTYSQKGIVLEVNNNVTINVSLKLGEVSQTVNVSANASMVQMTSSSVSQVRYPPQSGWLDEWGRLKGGHPLI